MRRTKTVTIPGKHSETLGNRDNGKTFLINEMSAAQAEAWGLNALTLVAQSGINLPEGISSYGMAGMALLGLDSLMKVDFVRAKPLLDEMMGCVQFVPDPAKPIPRQIDEASGTDIEEVSTRLLLRDEVFELHTGFSAAAAVRGILEAAKNLISPITTQTSQDQSQPASEAA
jgi:hypothetical protein